MSLAIVAMKGCRLELDSQCVDVADDGRKKAVTRGKNERQARIYIYESWSVSPTYDT